MHHMYYSSGIFGWIMGVIHLVFPLMVILILFRFFTGRGNSLLPVQSYRSERDPLEILKERYVGGEISREEFQRMKEEIRG
ncbi:hypothetical protein PM10SUCC1_08240 [Propionigenium maris DSM 9537]|uniref:SHOCT domain-containing protein n=1 Tax=Propionigenium maris DSM 9537 TaxID=1123000 RepID=A0A9W6LMW5_9FUSO|nr:SHOCT domain-containing protein [Propionigenium maris]GLI55310.1 hypothetical protein PM10SUCC1_08240 [Propionigenium maris DSM 9537]